MVDVTVAADAVTDSSGVKNRATTQKFTVQGTMGSVTGPADGGLVGMASLNDRGFLDVTFGFPSGKTPDLGTLYDVDTLDSLGLRARQHPLPDHALIDPAWLAALPGTFLVMTEKDAVKCAAFDPALLARCVALRVEAVPEPALVDWLEDRLRG